MEVPSGARRGLQGWSLQDNVPDVSGELTKGRADTFADAGARYGPAMETKMRVPIDGTCRIGLS